MPFEKAEIQVLCSILVHMLKIPNARRVKAKRRTDRRIDASLFSLGLNQALRQAGRQSQENELLVAYLNECISLQIGNGFRCL